MKKLPRVLCAHDLSGVGRCSLTSALPILSSAGLEACPLPTALLSTQTGGIEGYSCCDLTQEMRRMLDHWAQLGIGFDGIYTGYLGSLEQFPLIRETVERYREAYVLIDPVMGDSGALYGGFSLDYVQGFRELLALADLVTPNLTEACLLTGRDPASRVDSALAEELCLQIRDLGAREVVLTGLDQGTEIGCLVLPQGSDRPQTVLTPKIEGLYHGCGDIFSASLMACRMNGVDTAEACRMAADFTCGAILRTRELGLDSRFGMDFERDLPRFGAQFSKED